MYVAAAAVARCDPTRRVTVLEGVALGTGWRVCAVGDIAPLRTAIEARLDRIVAEMSQWAPGSILSRFNRSAAGAWTHLPPDFDGVIRTALAIADRTGGAFDPTHGRAAALLGFGAEPVLRPPTIEELDAVHAAAGWRRLEHDPHARRLRQPGGLWLDLSGIAKGFAVDTLADVLRDAGFPDALVEIGGELVGRGLKPDGQPWWVDLETPPGCDLPPLRAALHERALATSGDYVRGRHTLDPRTGLPLDGRIAAVSVIHDSAMLADAWATALTVLGPDRAIATADRESIAARIVLRDATGWSERISAALRAMMAD